MTYYIKGGSRYNEANPKVWVCLMLGGFPDADYLLTDWKNLDDKGHETAQDPFWRMGGSAGGAKEFELGLWGDYRLKFETTGITYWDGDTWEDLLAEGGAANLNELNDVVIDAPADNELLAWDNGTSKWINQTPAEADLATAGHGHAQLHDQSHSLASHSSEAHNELTGYNDETDVKHLTDAQLGALHTIYSLQQHNNDYHDPDFCVDDDSRLSDSRTPTQHAMDSIIYHSRTDITVLDASASFHGFLPKLSNVVTEFLNGQGGWTTPPSGGDSKEVSLQYVEDTGLVLSSAKVITSADENLSFTFGRTLIDARLNNYMVLSHRGMTTTANYSTRQNSVGETRINSAAGQVLNLCIGGSIKASVNASGLQVGSDARITEFDNGVLANSATKAPTSAAVFAAIDAAGGFTPPIGFIAMYSGVWVDNTTIVGWYKCDGNNGTPNLVDKFIRGAATSGGGGGSDDAVVVSHNHDLLVEGGSSSLQHATTATATRSWNNQIIGNRGVSGVNANIPAYYALIFIMRIS